MKKLYVGNLPWSTTEADLEELFSSYGPVHSAAVITDRDTGRSRGFGFIELDDSSADKAHRRIVGAARTVLSPSQKPSVRMALI